VDAVYKAINRLVQIPNQLIEFSVQSVTEGIDALGTVTIRLRYQERIFSGQASDTDIVVAAAYAYMSAMNRLYCYCRHREILQTPPQFSKYPKSSTTTDKEKIPREA
jgi:2-isopropylmalate synthase